MARAPRLLHPIPVYIRKKDAAYTAVMDDNLREPVGQVRRPANPVKLVAQIKRGNTDDPRSTDGGVVLGSDGYLLFLKKDLKRAHFTIEVGDRIVRIGEGDAEEAVDYYIVKTMSKAHYPRAGGATMVRAYFQDREPTRHRN